MIIFATLTAGADSETVFKPNDTGGTYICGHCRKPWDGPAPTFQDGRVMIIGAIYCSYTCFGEAHGIELPAGQQ